MAQQTKFEIEDAQQLLLKLEAFRADFQEEWQRVDSAWGNLKSCWFDRQFRAFQPVYEHLNNTHRSNERSLEKYAAFLQEQIRITQQQADKLKALGR